MGSGSGSMLAGPSARGSTYGVDMSDNGLAIRFVFNRESTYSKPWCFMWWLCLVWTLVFHINVREWTLASGPRWGPL